MKYDLIAVGELLIDFACEKMDADGYPTLTANPGGSVSNFLAAMAKFGCKTGLIGKVGNDTFGTALAGTLNKLNIDTEGLVMADDVFTTLAFVTFTPDGDRRFSFARKPGADTCLAKEEVRTDLIDAAKAVHFSSLPLTDEPARTAARYAITYAKDKGKLITFDPNLREPLWKDLKDAREQMLWGIHQADVLKISDNEVQFLFGDMPFEDCAKMLLNTYGVKLVFITLGKDGSLYCNKNACGRVPGLTGLKTIDTTGAGDIFGGSAVYRVLASGKAPEDLQKEELEKITRFACTVAGISTQTLGGITSVPAPQTLPGDIF